MIFSTWYSLCFTVFHLTGSRSLWGQTRGSRVWSRILVIFFTTPWLTSATPAAAGMRLLTTAEAVGGLCGTHGDSATAAVSRGGWRRRRDSHARGWSSSRRQPWSPLERALHQQKATWRVCPLRGVTGRFTFAVITDPLGLKADV